MLFAMVRVLSTMCVVVRLVAAIGPMSLSQVSKTALAGMRGHKNMPFRFVGIGSPAAASGDDPVPPSRWGPGRLDKIHDAPAPR